MDGIAVTLEEEFRERAIRAETEGIRKHEEGKHEAATHREGESTAFKRAALLVHLALLDQPEAALANKEGEN